ncbi:MFS transporter [Methanocella paludicola SANAE]|uniref:MFS transporter n=1 Tax=Methanocella paludicola (strain DSM 17711 / JCM 13418 / NBRC 101707 / SANAE) TaxID=304371 RepID=D1YYE2_METPS|nr:MFS transporter [Methanocella paludicola]BAI61464.1 MFS transporter [Methanocella paludicola SANAE]
MAEVTDKRLILLITCMSAFITPFLSSSINIALVSIGKEFPGTDEIMLGWVVTAFLLSAAIFVVPFGRIADIFGRRKFFIAGLGVIVVSSFLCFISNSVPVLVASRAIEGFGAAMIFGTAMAILTAAYPAKERGKVLGINMAVTYTGLSLGPVLGGLITQYLGWRYIYGGIMVFALIITLLAYLLIKDEWRYPETEKFDLPGTALYTVMLFSLMYGLTEVPGAHGFALIALGLLIMIVFFWWELRNKNPILKVSVLRKNTVFMFSNLAALINYSATFAVSFLLSFYLQYIRGYDYQTAGIILIAAPIIQAVFSPLTGRLSDKVEPRVVASAGMGLCVLGLALFALLTPETPLILVIGGLAFIGLGFALFSSPNTSAIMGSVEKRDLGVASGMVSTMRLIGQVMSLGIAMLLFSLYMGRIELIPGPNPALMSSIQTAFIVFAVLCVLGLIASVMRGDLRKKEVPVPAAPQKH